MLPDLLDLCRNEVPRDGWAWLVERNPETGLDETSSRMVTLTGKLAQICVFVGDRRRFAYVRRLDGGGVLWRGPHDWLEGDMLDHAWVRKRLAAALPWFDGYEEGA